MAKKFMVTITCGPGDPERATIGLGMAYTAIQSPDMEVVVGLQSNGVWLALAGMPDHVEADGMPPFKQMLDGFVGAGGRVIVCEPCANSRKLTAETCTPGVVIVPAQAMVEEMLSSDSSVVY